MKARVGAVMVTLMLAGCGSDDQPGAVVEEVRPAPAAVVFDRGLGLVPGSMREVADDVWIMPVRQGTGAVADPGATVTYSYRAWLPDGTLYEQRPNDEGFGVAEVVLGEAVPRGLNAGIAGMKAGGVRRIVVGPSQGYGLVGRPEGVSADATLVYEVELRSVTRN